MKRSALDFATLVTVLLTAFVLTKAGWVSSGRSASPRPAELCGATKTPNPYHSDAALRFRQCQATHWRACMLQR
jgi:hypothetical protein